MPGYADPLQGVVLSRTLWLMLLPLVLALEWHVAAALGRAHRGESGRDEALGWVVALAAVAVAAAATLGHVLLLSQDPKRRMLLERITNGARVGRLDAGISLRFDSLGASACSAACVVALGAVVFLVNRPAHQHDWRTWAWIELTLCGALISCLAEDSLTMAVGWTVASVAYALPVGHSHARDVVPAAIRGAVAIVALATGAALLFWGLGGRWSDNEYASETKPSWAVVRSGLSQAQAPSNTDSSRALLTMIDLPGTQVFIDDSRTALAIAPFVDVPLTPGLRSVRLRTEGASTEALLRVGAAPGDGLALAPLGPSLSFRGIASTLGFRGVDGERPYASAFAAAQGPAAGIGIQTDVLALWIVAALAVGFPRASPIGASPWIVLANAGTHGILGPYLLARSAFLLPLPPDARIVVAVVCAALLAGAAMPVIRAFGRRSVPRGTLPDGDRTAPASPSWLEEVPSHAGALLVRYERGVLDSLAAALTGVVYAVAWISARSDGRILSAPGDAAGARVGHLARSLESRFGGSLPRVVWTVLVALGTAVLLARVFQLGRDP